MEKNDGRFKKGERRSPETEFKPGTHWRQRKPFWNKSWLEHEYRNLGRSASDIGDQFGVGSSAIEFWLGKHGIPRRTVAEARAIKYWGASGADNPMWNKRGELSPNWRGGLTPERQAFYASREWKDACASVRKRDKTTCRRCGLFRYDQPDMPFHIHHIVSFMVEKKRADPDNLVLLCEVCHRFIHSRENVDGEFLSQE